MQEFKKNFKCSVEQPYRRMKKRRGKLGGNIQYNNKQYLKILRKNTIMAKDNFSFPGR